MRRGAAVATVHFQSFPFSQTETVSIKERPLPDPVPPFSLLSLNPIALGTSCRIHTTCVFCDWLISLSTCLQGPSVLQRG